jgi:beta-lactamase regulating signal transducer with metallopeptidase domain
MMSLNELMSQFAPGDALSAVLGILKATLVLLVVFAAIGVMRRTSAHTRHLVLLVAMVALVALPVLSVWSPIRVAILPATSPAATSSAETFAPPPVQPASASENVVRQQTSATEDRSDVATAAAERGVVTAPGGFFKTAMNATLGIAVVWGLIAAGILAWLAHGAYVVRRIVRSGESLDSSEWRTPLWEVSDRLGLEQTPRLVLSDATDVPFACGLLHPTVVLPSEASTWSEERRRAVLLHELSHVRRRDLVGHTVGRLACALYWFHPLVWTAAKRLRVESERACDDLALSCGARASDYAEHLLDIVAGVRRRATPAVALPIATRSEFEGRMLAILDPGQRRAALSRPRAAVLLTGLGALFVSIAAMAPAPRAAAPIVATPDSSLVRQPVNEAVVPQDTLPVRAPALSTPPRAAQYERRVDSTTEHVATNRWPQGKPIEIDSIADAAVSLVLPYVRSLLTGDSLKKTQGRTTDRATLLAGVLRSDTSADLRRVAAWGLGQLDRSDVAASALATAIRRDANASVREMAAWAAASSHNDETGEALAQAVRDDDNTRVRTTSAWAIAHFRSSSAVPALSAAMRDTSASVRAAAAWALGHMSLRTAPPELVAALRDREPRVREKVAWALYQIRDPETADEVNAAFRAERDDSSLRRAYLYTLAALGERSASALADLLETNDPAVRDLAIRALAGSGSFNWPMPWPMPRPQP